MTTTRQTTPVVPPPEQKARPVEVAPKRPLKAPILVVSTGREWSHEKGSLTIGRDFATDVTIDDPLVSRAHARLLVQSDGHVLLEDLHSSNGVFVNGSKISRPSVQLCEGDSMLFGTTEVSVFSLRSSATVPVVHRIAPAAASAAEAVPVGCRPSARQGSSASAPQRTPKITGRHDAIDMVGRLAEQLQAGGHCLEAERILSEHLQSLLKGASVGLTVSESILESATRYALLLHDWTQRNAWVDYAFELHIACQCLPSEPSLRALETACRAAQGLDSALIRYLVNSVEGTIDGTKAEQADRLQRLRRLMR